MTVDRLKNRTRSGSVSHTQAQQDKFEALERFASGMAHDLNNILHVIKTTAELLRIRLDRQDPELGRLLEMVRTNTERAIQLGQEALAFSSRQALHCTRVDLNALLHGMRGELEANLPPGLAIALRSDPDLWPVEADPAELERAIQQLVQNARDASPDGGTIAIATANRVVDEGECGVPAGAYATVTVRDEGMGMTAETAARVFDPYFTTKRGRAAPGLGLSRVYGLVRQLRGQIAIDSAPQRGTSVTIYLRPLTPQQAYEERGDEQSPDEVGAASDSRPTADGLAGLRVLVVEDESLIAMLAEDLLEQLGCVVVGVASTVEQALDLVKQVKPDVGVLDIDVGGESVYPVALALEAHGVPYLFMSGYGAPSAPWSSRPIVQKPFDAEELRAAIARAVTGEG